MRIEDDHETARDHLPRDTGRIEGDHLGIYRRDHLRFVDDCEAEGPRLAVAVENILALSTDELASYRAELADVPDADPNIRLERMALARFDALLAGEGQAS